MTQLQKESRSPSCTKCKTPMTWDSVQTVDAGGREESMDVFRCDTCGRLTALLRVSEAA